MISIPLSPGCLAFVIVDSLFLCLRLGFFFVSDCALFFSPSFRPLSERAKHMDGWILVGWSSLYTAHDYLSLSFSQGHGNGCLAHEHTYHNLSSPFVQQKFDIWR